jgi:hypothetical protein
VDVIVPIAILAAVLGLVFTRSLRGLRGPLTDQPGDEPCVTLAVLPGRRAVVTVDVEPERSPGTADLVDQAVHDAFTFEGVDGVEVRRADGELLERRMRSTPDPPAMPLPVAPLPEGRPPLALRDPDM